MQGIYLKVLLYANFFRATFFVFCQPLNSQQGLAKPPPENKWGFRTYVQCLVFDIFVCNKKQIDKLSLKRRRKVPNYSLWKFHFIRTFLRCK